MNVSCARSSASSRSRTMRKISEKTGRSYRRISSRNAASRPCWASATTSASGRLRRSRAGGGACGIGWTRASIVPCAARRFITKYAGLVRQTSRVALASPLDAPATFADARERVGIGRSAAPRRPAATRSAPMCSGSSRRSRRATTCSITSSASTSTERWRRAAIAALGWERAPARHVPRPVRRHARRRRRAGAAAGLRRPRRRRRLRRADAARRASGRRRRRSSRRSSPTRSTSRSRDAASSGAIVAFGIRNVADLDAGAARGASRARAGRALRHPRVHDAAIGARSRAAITSTSITCCRASARLSAGTARRTRICRARSPTFRPRSSSRRACAAPASPTCSGAR